MMIIRVIEEMIRRKTKMDRNPKKLASTPPRTGPTAILKFRTVQGGVGQNIVLREVE